MMIVCTAEEAYTAVKSLCDKAYDAARVSTGVTRETLLARSYALCSALWYIGGIKNNDNRAQSQGTTMPAIPE